MSSLSRTLSAALALAALANAQRGSSDSCSASDTLTVTNTAQLASVSACSTYSGSITIATGVSAVSLDGPKRITGDFVVLPDGALGSLEASDLQTVDGKLSLDTLQSLGSVSMPSLRSVDTLFISNTGQNFLNLDFGSTGVTQVNSLTVDSTYLQTLGGINLTTAGDMTITNNQLLTSLIMPLQSTTGDIIVRGNTNGLSVNLNNLESTNNFYINSVTAVALQSLENVTGTFSAIGISSSSLLLPNLTRAIGFTVQDNSDLANLTTPSLYKVASININDNPELTQVLSFPALYQVIGAVNITGAFAGISAPKLNSVNGTFFVESSNSSFSSSCDTFSNEPQVFSNDPTCTVVASSTSGTNTPTGTQPGSTSSPTNNAGVHYTAPASTLTLLGAVAAVLTFFF